MKTLFVSILVGISMVKGQQTTPIPTYPWFPATDAPTDDPTPQPTGTTSTPTLGPTQKPTPQPTSVEPTPAPSHMNADTGPAAANTPEPTPAPSFTTIDDLPASVDTPKPTPEPSHFTGYTPQPSTATSSTSPPDASTTESGSTSPTKATAMPRPDLPIETSCLIEEFETWRCMWGENNHQSYLHNYTVIAPDCGENILLHQAQAEVCSKESRSARHMDKWYHCEVRCESQQFMFRDDPANQLTVSVAAVAVLVMTVYTALM